MKAVTPTPERARATDSRTRDRVLRSISEHGPVTSTALAGRLGVTGTAIRRHLDKLERDGLVERRTLSVRSRGRGRPASAFVLTPAGHSALRSDYDHLAGAAVRFLAETAGEEAVGAFARRRASDLERSYRPVVEAAGRNPGERAAALVTALTADGYAASARPVVVGEAAGGVQLCQGHCPVQSIAAEFPQFCDAETDAFSALLGVHVQRLATLASGAHVCTTFLPAAALGGGTSPDSPDSGDVLARHTDDPFPTPLTPSPATEGPTR